jgi:hypothetical protein
MENCGLGGSCDRSTARPRVDNTQGFGFEFHSCVPCDTNFGAGLGVLYYIALS